VFVAYTSDEPKPNPDEVAAYRWLDWPDYVAMLSNPSVETSFWAEDQYRQLRDLEPFTSL
jgi:isopentenyl-diphosphate delta-isomerase